MKITEYLTQGNCHETLLATSILNNTRQGCCNALAASNVISLFFGHLVAPQLRDKHRRRTHAPKSELVHSFNPAHHPCSSRSKKLTPGEEIAGSLLSTCAAARLRRTPTRSRRTPVHNSKPTHSPNHISVIGAFLCT